jgi:ChrR Cupin-like domain
MKEEREFFDTGALPWSPGAPGIDEKVLSRAPGSGGDGDLTRLARWAPGHDTSADGVVRHPYHEEVYLVEGELEDLTLDLTFRVGHYASRPPGMPHGPYRTTTGCTMLEIRSPAPRDT